MASQAQKNQEKWNKYVFDLQKAGIAPPEKVCKAYQQASQLWNTVDIEASSDLADILNNH